VLLELTYSPLLPSVWPLTPALLFTVPPMTEVSRIADSTTFKVAVPILQTILSAGAIGAFVYVVGSLGSLQMQLAAYQTNQALIGQRVDSLERSRESTDKLVDSLRVSTQRQEFKIDQVGESLKALVQTGRPK
jgi:hypothetical protein